jgi:arylsulfatase A-like enzyme
VINDLVSLTDLAPTLLECGGAKVPKQMTGRSLVKIFKTDKSGMVDKRRKYVFAGKERHTLCREGELAKNFSYCQGMFFGIRKNNARGQDSCDSLQPPHNAATILQSNQHRP